MGHQVNFYVTPQDRTLLEERLREIGPMLVLHSRSPTSAVRKLETLDFAENGKPWLFFYLVRPEDLSAIITRHVPVQGYWTIDVLKSPVVEFNSCFFNGDKLRRGRVYYIDSYYGEDDVLVQKSESFQAWAKSLFGVVKKSLKKRGADYVGPHAIEWLSSDGGALDSGA